MAQGPRVCAPVPTQPSSGEAGPVSSGGHIPASLWGLPCSDGQWSELCVLGMGWVLRVQVPQVMVVEGHNLQCGRWGWYLQVTQRDCVRPPPPEAPEWVWGTPSHPAPRTCDVFFPGSSRDETFLEDLGGQWVLPSGWGGPPPVVAGWGLLAVQLLPLSEPKGGLDWTIPGAPRA